MNLRGFQKGMNLCFLVVRESLTVGLFIYLVNFKTCFGQDLRNVLFLKSNSVANCLVDIGVRYSQDPVTHSVRSRAECATHCLEDGHCTKFLYCPKLNPNLNCPNCHRIKVFGVFNTEETRDNCDCYIRSQQLPCKHGGILDSGSCRCLHGFYGSTCENVITDCNDGFQRGDGTLGGNPWGFAYIRPHSSPATFPVYCLNFWGGYTYVLQRIDKGKRVLFNRTWQEYRQGFGNLEGDFWMGLEQIYTITKTQTSCDVMIHNSDIEIQMYYRPFYVENESLDYTVRTGSFYPHTNNPDAVDSFRAPNNQSIDGRPFITFDHNPANRSSCPEDMRSGWWFNTGCTAANLNGPAITEEEFNENPNQPRITWVDMGYVSYAHMRLSVP